VYTYVKWVAFPIKKFEAHYIFTKLKPPTIHLPTTHLIITYVTTNITYYQPKSYLSANLLILTPNLPIINLPTYLQPPFNLLTTYLLPTPNQLITYYTTYLPTYLLTYLQLIYQHTFNLLHYKESWSFGLEKLIKKSLAFLPLFSLTKMPFFTTFGPIYFIHLTCLFQILVHR